MVRFLTRRLLVGVATIIAISIIVFGLFFAVPSSPAKVMCGKNCDPVSIAAVETRLGLRRAHRHAVHRVHEGHLRRPHVRRRALPSSRNATAPCLGFSFRNNEPVSAILARTLPVTLSIVAGAAVLWLLIGVSLGMISALRRGTVFDKVAIGISLAGASMQVFFFGLILLFVFVYTTGILAFPSYTPLTENPAKWASGLILPWITLGFLNSAIYARLSRARCWRPSPRTTCAPPAPRACRCAGSTPSTRCAPRSRRS